VIDISEKLANYSLRSQLDEAVYIQDKLQMFSLPFFRYNSSSYAFQEFLKQMRNKINNEKAFNTFRENINYPLPTVNFIKTVNDSISKIFEGDGKFIKYIPEQRNIDGIPTFDYIKNDIWTRFIHAPNTLVLTTKDKRFFIDITAVKYLTLNSDNTVNEIIYLTENKEYWYIDSSVIGVYNQQYEFISEEKHGLNVNPVTFISDKLPDFTKPIIRGNHLLDSLGDIEELLIIGILENIINRHIIPYVVKASQTGCRYNEGNQFCKNGYIWQTIKNESPVQVISDGKPVKCKHCNSEIGFGSVIEIETKNLDADQIAKVIQNVIEYKHLSIDILKHPSEVKKAKEQEIHNKIVNKQETLNNAQQHNKERVESTYENPKSVLFYWKMTFEKIYSELITKTLKYKNNNYKNTEVSLGNKFFLNSELEYQKLIEQSQLTETTDYVNYYRGLIEKQYSGNESEKQRALFILDLSIAGKPYFNIKSKELIELLKNESIDILEFKLNKNFMMYIRLIELETNESIDKYEIEKNYSERIKLITQKINEYAKL
jgi:hypothetical protein